MKRERERREGEEKIVQTVALFRFLASLNLPARLQLVVLVTYVTPTFPLLVPSLQITIT